jgi:hypothetical protein
VTKLVAPGHATIQGHPNQTVTPRMARHELGHAWHHNNRSFQNAVYAERFATCVTAPRTFDEALRDMNSWHSDPRESIAEVIAIVVKNDGLERTLNHGCEIEMVLPALRTFFGGITIPLVQFEQHFTPNRWPGGLNWGYDVVHTTEGTSSLSWIKNPSSQVSYTYLIPRIGPKVYVLGDPLGDAFWHAGAVCDPITTPLYDGVNPNRRSRGIAMEGKAAERATDFQIDTVVELIRSGGKPWTGHFALAGCNRSDPGAGNMALIAAELGMEVDEMLRPDERDWLFTLVQLGHEQKNALVALAKHLGATGTLGAKATMRKAPPAPVRFQSREKNQKGKWDGPGTEPKPARGK